MADTYSIWLERSQRARVGTLRLNQIRGKLSSSFVYADDWLISPLGFALSPDLPRASEKAAKRYCAAIIKGYIFSRVRRFSEPLPFTVAPCWNRISKIGSSAS